MNFGYGISLGADRKFHFTTNGTGSASIGTFAGSTSASTVAGTIQIDRDISIGNGNLTGNGLTIGGVISGVGAVQVGNSTGYTTRFSGANTYEGGTTIAGGKLTVLSSGKLGSGPVTVSAEALPQAPVRTMGSGVSPAETAHFALLTPHYYWGAPSHNASRCSTRSSRVSGGRRACSLRSRGIRPNPGDYRLRIGYPIWKSRLTPRTTGV